MKIARRPSSHCALREGFTLVELLVVISIIVLLLTMTAITVNFSRDSERVVGAALQVQSFLSGARDRAIHAKEPRGVRFFLDSNNFRAITAMAYIDPAEYWSGGDAKGVAIRLERPDLNGDNVADSASVTIVAGNTQNQWWQLKRRGLLFDGLRIRIPKGPTGTWYTISTQLIDLTNPPPEAQYLVLQTPYVDPGISSPRTVDAFNGAGPTDYELELPPRILPMDPVRLPLNTIIDLDGSKVPQAWRPLSAAGGSSSGNFEYSQFMDVVFSPKGSIVGGAAAGGVIQFYICDQQDSIALKEQFVLNDISYLTPNPTLPPGAPASLKFSSNGLDLPTAKVMLFNQFVTGTRFIPTLAIRSSSATWLPDYPDTNPYLVRDRRIVTLFTQTGAVSSHPVFMSDFDFDGIENDPMYFAETGRSGQ